MAWPFGTSGGSIEDDADLSPASLATSDENASAEEAEAGTPYRGDGLGSRALHPEEARSRSLFAA